MLPAFRGRETENQHVLGQPSLFLAQPACEPKRQTFLAEKRIATIPRADRPNGVLLGKMADEAPLGAEIAEGMKALGEVVITRQGLEMIDRNLSDAGHDPHVEDHVL